MLGVLQDADGPVREGKIAVRANIASKRLKNLLVQLEVEGAVTKAPDGWQRTMLAWTYPHDRVDQVNEWKRAEQAAMAEYLELEGCRMAFLQQQLDDAPAGPCGVCDNCRDDRTGKEPDEAVVDEAKEELLGAHVEIEPRKQWPAGLDEESGKIPAENQAEVGWCLAHWGDAGWGPLVRTGKQQKGRFDDDLVDAFADLVEQKSTESPPQWITHVPSLRHPEPVADLTARLGDRISLPMHDVISKTRETRPQKEVQNSHQQVRNVWGAFEVRGPHPSGPCHLVDDVIDSRWTSTIIAGLLRRSGVEVVTPYALAYAGQSDT